MITIFKLGVLFFVISVSILITCSVWYCFLVSANEKRYRNKNDSICDTCITMFLVIAILMLFSCTLLIFSLFFEN